MTGTLESFADERVAVYTGDCRDLLDLLPAGSVDAVVTDPPYELGFMGKGWDSTGIAYDVEVWRKAYRALKPGGHLLAFGGTRTWHRLACAIEDAGFELRDNIAWLTGSGFPKSKSQLKPGFEPIVVARKPLAGTVAANVLAHGTGAINVDACRVAHASAADLAMSLGKNPGRSDNVTSGVYGADRPQQSVNTAGRWPSNVVFSHPPMLDGDGEMVGDACADGCVEGCPVAELDAQSGITKSSGGAGAASARTKNGNTYGEYTEPVAGSWSSAGGLGDTGGASRYFPTFRYQAKAPSKERPKVDGKAHPTVKPLALMRWLVRLVTPPDGLIVDPFAGTATTLEAAVLEGFRAIGAEQEADHLPLIRVRMARLPALERAA